MALQIHKYLLPLYCLTRAREQPQITTRERILLQQGFTAHMSMCMATSILT